MHSSETKLTHKKGRMRKGYWDRDPPCTNYLCTYDLYCPVHNALDACISITRGSGRGLGPGILGFFGALWNGIEPVHKINYLWKLISPECSCALSWPPWSRPDRHPRMSRHPHPPNPSLHFSYHPPHPHCPRSLLLLQWRRMRGLAPSQPASFCPKRGQNGASNLQHVRNEVWKHPRSLKDEKQIRILSTY